MYAVVTTGGKQYRVEAGSELVIERAGRRMPVRPITFDRVLLVGDGETVTVGTPTVDGATVSAHGPRRGARPEARDLQVQAEGQVPPHDRASAAPDPRPDRRDLGRRQDGEGGAARSDAREGRGGDRPKRPRPRSRDRPDDDGQDARPRRRRQAGDDQAKRTTAGRRRQGRGIRPSDQRGRTEADAAKPKRTRKPAAPKAKANARGGDPGVTDGTQEGRLVQQERARQRRQAPRRQARRRAVRPRRDDHRPPARQHLPPRRRTSGWAGTTRSSPRPTARSDSPTRHEVKKRVSIEAGDVPAA